MAAPAVAEVSYDAQMHALAYAVARAFNESAGRVGTPLMAVPVQARAFFDLLERGVIEVGPGLCAGS